ncbi:hypothetical protein [Thalassococcus sp. BH17M4-6]
MAETCVILLKPVRHHGRDVGDLTDIMHMVPVETNADGWHVEFVQ